MGVGCFDMNHLVGRIDEFEASIMGESGDGQLPSEDVLNPMGLTRAHVNKLLWGMLTSKDDVDWKVLADHFDVNEYELKTALDIRHYLKMYGSLNLREVKSIILMIKDIICIPDGMEEFAKAFFERCSKAFFFTGGLITFQNEVKALPQRQNERAEFIFDQSGGGLGTIVTKKQIVKMDDYIRDIAHQVMELQKEGVIGKKIGRSIVEILYDLFFRDWYSIYNMLGIKIDHSLLRVVREYETGKKSLGRFRPRLNPKRGGWA